MVKNQRILSPNFINCSRDDLIILIARMLNSLISINDKYNPDSIDPSNLTRFHSRTPPGISVYSYLARLARYSSIENAVLIATVYYIDLLSAIYSPFTLNSLTVHRFLLTATTVGSKGLCDSFCTNSHYAKVGGIQSNELDILEREFLTKVNYRILPRDLNIKNCEIEKKIQNVNRKGSISTLEDEKSILNNDSDDENENDLVLNQINLKNAGYNVLDIYYKKMIQLIGKETDIDDTDVEHFEYILGDEDENLSHDDTIKTEPDTLSNDLFNKMIKDLPNQFNSIHAANTINSDILLENSKKNLNSPLKRQIDNAYIPNSKKSTITK